MSLKVAIDGPSGAGKSTIAREVAKRVGFTYVDTGAIYRAIGCHIFRQGGDPSDESVVLPALDDISLSIEQLDDGQHIFLNGEDVSGEIRRHEMSEYASAVSAIPGVRAFLLDTQRQLAQSQNCIMDGRDIGTVVLPDADLKIFLTASPEERAARRYRELEAAGSTLSFKQVLSDIEARDLRDTTRAAAPLKRAADAILLDTTGNTKQQSIERVEKIIREKLGNAI